MNLADYESQMKEDCQRIFPRRLKEVKK